MQFMVVSCKRSRPAILEAIFSRSFRFRRPPGAIFDLFFTSFCASEIALAVAAAVLRGRLPPPCSGTTGAVAAGGVGAADDEEGVAVVGGGAAGTDGGGVGEFESVIPGTSFESSNELCFPNLRTGLVIGLVF